MTGDNFLFVHEISYENEIWRTQRGNTSGSMIRTFPITRQNNYRTQRKRNELVRKSFCPSNITRYGGQRYAAEITVLCTDK